MAPGLSLRAALAAGALALVAGCGDAPASTDAAAEPTSSPSASTPPVVQADPVEAVKPKPLRAGETRMSLRIPKTYTPSAPNGVGTDDYRCFLLDPHLTRDAFLTGHVREARQPQRRPPRDPLPRRPRPGGRRRAARRPGPRRGLDLLRRQRAAEQLRPRRRTLAGRLGPGATESVDAPGFGTPLAAGSQIVMQVHYNLLGGPGPDRSATLLRLAPGSEHLTPLTTMLLPAPVELPCRPGHTDNPLCDRDAAVADVIKRFGPVGNTNNLLDLFCNQEPEALAGHLVRADDQRADHDPRRGRSHAPARPLDQDRGQPRHAAGQDGAQHPGLGLRQPGLQADQAGEARRRRHGEGHLQARAVAARQAPGVPRPARPLRRLGRGDHRTRCVWASSPSPIPDEGPASEASRCPRRGWSSEPARASSRARRPACRDPVRSKALVRLTPAPVAWDA